MTFKLAQSIQNRTLTAYQFRLNQQLQLLRHIRNNLPHPLADHVIHCVLNEKRLVIYTDSAAWASQLRFHKDQILQAVCKARNEPLEKLQVRILTDQISEKRDQHRKANLPSAEKIGLIRKEGNNLRDSQLGRAFQKLSATLAKLADHDQ